MRRRRQRDRRAEVAVDHGAIIFRGRRRKRAHDDRPDRMHDDVERPAPRFDLGHEIRGRRRPGKIVGRCKNIGIVFGHAG